jgi:hypothetical protein
VTAVVERREALHRRALLLEYCTVGWNVVEAVVAIGAGVLAGSVALIGFGADSAIEVLSAVGLLWRLRKAGPHAPIEEESEAEKRALCVVAITFFLLASYITYEGITSVTGRDCLVPALASGHAHTGVCQAAHRQADGQPGTRRRLQRDVGLLLPLTGAAHRYWIVRILRLVVGRPIGALVMLPVIIWQGWETLTEAREHDDSDVD